MLKIQTNSQTIPVSQKDRIAIWEALELGRHRVLLYLEIGRKENWPLVRFDMEVNTEWKMISRLPVEVIPILKGFNLPFEQNDFVAFGTLKDNRQHYGTAILVAGAKHTGFLRKNISTQNGVKDTLRRLLDL